MNRTNTQPDILTLAELEAVHRQARHERAAYAAAQFKSIRRRLRQLLSGARRRLAGPTAPPAGRAA